MMLKVCHVVAAGLGLALLGCASFGPLGTADFEPILRRDIPIEGKLVYQSPGSLLLGQDGYGPGANTSTLGEGVVVLTEQKLYFVKWFQNKYEDKWNIEYGKINLLEIRSFGLGRRLVIKSYEKPIVVSLEVATDSGQMVDPQRTLTVCTLIAQYARKECKLPQTPPS